MKTVTVFGSAHPGEASKVYQEARRLGQLLAEADFAVCNGGYGGLMEASARGAREAGGHTTGVTCVLWPRPANAYIVQEVRTQSFTERLMTLIERGDAFVTLPGGTGTLAELALVWEMMNKQSLAKSVGGRKPVLALAPYWQPVLDCLRQESELVPEGVSSPASALEIVTMVASPEQALQELQKSLCLTQA
jgi:uncharacterized protein (TIGR00730 family)